jgi:hypothetical protein
MIVTPVELSAWFIGFFIKVNLADRRCCNLVVNGLDIDRFTLIFFYSGRYYISLLVIYHKIGLWLFHLTLKLGGYLALWIPWRSLMKLVELYRNRLGAKF